MICVSVPTMREGTPLELRERPSDAGTITRLARLPQMEPLGGQWLEQLARHHLRGALTPLRAGCVGIFTFPAQEHIPGTLPYDA